MTTATTAAKSRNSRVLLRRTDKAAYMAVMRRADGTTPAATSRHKATPATHTPNSQQMADGLFAVLSLRRRACIYLKRMQRSVLGS